MRKLDGLVMVFASCVLTSGAFNYPQLRQLHVVFRHGDRKPVDSVGGDLTNEGKRRSLDFGERLRRRYDGFLGDHYQPSTTSALSTAYVRARNSLQLVLAGLYPPQGHQKWHESLNWQPIPFSYSPQHDDVLLFPKNCPLFDRAHEDLKRSPEYQAMLDPYRDLMRNLTARSGERLENFHDMFLLYHKLDSLRSMNRSLPAWAHGLFPGGPLLEAAYAQYDVLKFTDWMAKINGGALMRKVTEDMAAGNGTTGPGLFLYSSHEMLVVALLQTLKLWEPRFIPEYSSAAILELREMGGSYFVKVAYYKGVPAEFEDREIPGCQSLCPLAKFIALISDQLPEPKEIVCTGRDGRAGGRR